MDGLDASPLLVLGGVVTSAEPLRVRSSLSVVEALFAGEASVKGDAQQGLVFVSVSGERVALRRNGMSIAAPSQGVAALEITAKNGKVGAAAPDMSLCCGGSHASLRGDGGTAALTVRVSEDVGLSIHRDSGCVAFGPPVPTASFTSLPLAAEVHGDMYASGVVTHASSSASSAPRAALLSDGANVLTAEVPLHSATLRGVPQLAWMHAEFHVPFEADAGVLRVVQRGVRHSRVVMGEVEHVRVDLTLGVVGREERIFELEDVALTEEVDGFVVPVYASEDGLYGGLAHHWSLAKDASPTHGSVPLEHSGVLDVSPSSRIAPPPPVGAGCLEVSKLCSVRTASPLPVSSSGWTVCVWYCCAQRVTAGSLSSPILSVGSSSQTPISCFRLYRHANGFGLTTNVFGTGAAASSSGCDVLRWYHLAVVRQGEHLLLFVDAGLVGSVPAPAGAAEDAYLAAPSVGGGVCDFYRLCDLRFYDRPLDAAVLERFGVHVQRSLASSATVCISPQARFAPGDVVSVGLRFRGRTFDTHLPKVDLKLFPSAPNRFPALPSAAPQLRLDPSISSSAVARHTDVALAIGGLWDLPEQHHRTMVTSHKVVLGEGEGGAAMLHVHGDASLPRDVRAIRGPGGCGAEVRAVDTSVVPAFTVPLPFEGGRRFSFVNTVSAGAWTCDGVAFAHAGPLVRPRYSVTLLVRRAGEMKHLTTVEASPTAPLRTLASPLLLPSAVPPNASHVWPLAGDLQDRSTTPIHIRPCGVAWVAAADALHGMCADLSDVEMGTSAPIGVDGLNWSLSVSVRVPAEAEAGTLLRCAAFVVHVRGGEVGLSAGTATEWRPLPPDAWTRVTVSRNVHSALTLAVGHGQESATVWTQSHLLQRSRLRVGPAAGGVMAQDLRFYDRTLAASDLAMFHAPPDAAEGADAYLLLPLRHVASIHPGDAVEVTVRGAAARGVGSLTVSLVRLHDNPAEDYGGVVLREGGEFAVEAPGTLSLPAPSLPGHVANASYVDRGWREVQAPMTVHGTDGISFAVEDGGEVIVGGALSCGKQVRILDESPPSSSPSYAATRAYAHSLLTWPASSPASHVLCSASPIAASAASREDVNILRNSRLLAHLAPFHSILPFLFLRDFGNLRALDFVHWLGVAAHDGQEELRTADASVRITASGDVHTSRVITDALVHLSHPVSLGSGVVTGSVAAPGIRLMAPGAAEDLVMGHSSSGVSVGALGVVATLSAAAEAGGIAHLLVGESAPTLYGAASLSMLDVSSSSSSLRLPEGTAVEEWGADPSSIVSMQGFVDLRGAGWTAVQTAAVRSGRVSVIPSASLPFYSSRHPGAALDVFGDLALTTTHRLLLRGVPQKVGWWEEGQELFGGTQGVVWAERMRVGGAADDDMGLFGMVCSSPTFFAGGTLLSVDLGGIRFWDANSTHLAMHCDGTHATATSAHGFIYENASDALLLSVGDDIVHVRGGCAAGAPLDGGKAGAVVGGGLQIDGDLYAAHDVEDAYGNSVVATFLLRRGYWRRDVPQAVHVLDSVGAGTPASASSSLSVSSSLGLSSPSSASLSLTCNLLASSSKRAAADLHFLSPPSSSAGSLRLQSDIRTVERAGDLVLAGDGKVMIGPQCVVGASSTILSSAATAFEGVLTVTGALGEGFLPPLDVLSSAASPSATLAHLDEGDGIVARTLLLTASAEGALAIPSLQAGSALSWTSPVVTMGGLDVAATITISGDVVASALSISPLALDVNALLAVTPPPSAAEHVATRLFASSEVAGLVPSSLWSASTLGIATAGGMRVGEEWEDGEASLTVVGTMRCSGAMGCSGLRFVGGSFAVTAAGVEGPAATTLSSSSGMVHGGRMQCGASEAGEGGETEAWSWMPPSGVAASDERGRVVAMSEDGLSALEGGALTPRALPGRAYAGKVLYCPVLRLFACFEMPTAAGSAEGFIFGQPRRARLFVSRDGGEWTARPLRLASFSVAQAWDEWNPKYGELAGVRTFELLPGGGFCVAGPPRLRPSHATSTWHHGYFTRDGVTWTALTSSLPREVAPSCFGEAGEGGVVMADGEDVLVQHPPSSVRLPHAVAAFIRLPSGAVVAAHNSSLFSVAAEGAGWGGVHTHSSTSDEGAVAGVWYVGGEPFAVCGRSLYHLSSSPSAPYVRWEKVASATHIRSLISDGAGGVVAVRSGGRQGVRVAPARRTGGVLAVGALSASSLSLAEPLQTTSDARVKRNVADLTLSPSSLPPGVSYDERLSGERRVGFVAQDVAELLGPYGLVAEGDGGTLSVDYDGMIAATIVAFQALARQVMAPP